MDYPRNLPERVPELDPEPDCGPRTIVVNGHRCQISEPTIGYAEVVRLAYPNLVRSTNRDFTVTYRNGPPSRREGVLVDVLIIPAIDEETFVVTVTDRS